MFSVSLFFAKWTMTYKFSIWSSEGLNFFHTLNAIGFSQEFFEVAENYSFSIFLDNFLIIHNVQEK